MAKVCQGAPQAQSHDVYFEPWSHAARNASGSERRFWDVLGRMKRGVRKQNETWIIYIICIYIYISIYIYIYNTKITVYYMIIYAADIISTQQTL